MRGGNRDDGIVVDRSSEEPVYEQIARAIRGRIASGQLPPGRVLPSVRVVASDLGVNLNTVARAYRLLEEEGFLVIRNRSGVEVAPPGGSATTRDRDRLRESLREVLARMRQAGLSGAALERTVARELRRLGGGTNRRKGR